ncbi:MAG: M23 family metallopeptidase [Bacteroidetes bacterium]|nr:M23 family metallopeptidase [Bacteroidota bacterium]
MERKQNRRKLLKKLKNRYRLLIINETNLQEKTSLSLTPSNVLLIGSAGLLIFSLISWGIYTLFPGVKDYAPGYSQTFDGKMKNEVLRKISTLESELEMSKKREVAMKQIISGEDVTAYDIPYKAEKSREKEIVGNESKAEPDNKPKDTRITSTTPSTGSIGIYEPDDIHDDYLFFTPLKGSVSMAFNNRTHPSLDIVPIMDETVKATMDGTVIFSGWTPEYGYIISVQHQNNWLSIYKYNAAVYKELGSYVKAGETIGVIGYTDKDNPKKQLRFELWHNGVAVNPLNYIVF